MFSVVIPLYNKEQFISKTLESVLNQSYQSFEVLIVDDGSIDESIANASKFLKDSRFHIIQQQNQGVSSARNTGIKNAKFPFIAFLDADDLWHPQFLEIMMHAIKTHPDGSIFGSDYAWVYSQEISEFNKITVLPLSIRVNDYFMNASKNLIFCSSASVVQKEALFEVGLFNEMLSTGEDLDLWFRIMLNKVGYHIPANLALYMRFDKEQVGPAKLAPLEKTLIGNALTLYKSQLINKDTRRGFNEFIFSFILSNLLYYYFDALNKKKAVSLLKELPFRYKASRPRFVLYFLPYNLAKYIYQKLRRTKG